ncbi:MAG: IS66 family insertion sequence element accessory protein TnpA [Bacteroidota bacterium]|jgi:hypothetical protein
MSSTRTRKNYSRSQITDYLEQWKQSTQSKRDFCTLHQLNYHTFHNWQKHAQRQHKKTIPPPAPSGFVSVNLSSSAPVTSAREPHVELLVNTNGERQVIFYTIESLEHLKHLLG